MAAGLFKRKVLVAGTLISANTVRFEPPLIIRREEIDEVLNRLSDTLKEMARTPSCGIAKTLSSVMARTPRSASAKAKTPR